ncbi:hypothetical protein JAAARDRAFT_139448 [Jaapia argillacea MUCL 33604]|uniref:DUF6570 domain-containing protein n=1 Tax=Jaapia argillacea MUCL 33604 TaxID=933084 RepID=A0A067PB79_9AGAM|nr:hypothetical protein JAAARDRAFT_139448 [Jaapia argillacea MUCL 33604]
MCSSCYTALVTEGKQPVDSLANFQYYVLDRLPEAVNLAFCEVSMFDIMLIAKARATRIMHLFSDKKDNPVAGVRRDTSQSFSRGNVAIIPQNSVKLRALLPPDRGEVADAMCALFVGGNTKPTNENIFKLSPVLVSKQCVKVLADFLAIHNRWYRLSETRFSQKNLDDLFSERDMDQDEAIPQDVEISFLPTNDRDQFVNHGFDWTDRCGDDRNEAEADNNVLVMEAVGYTAGEHTPENYCIMKAKVLAWCLNRRKFIRLRGGADLMNDNDPALLSCLFPNLDPWGIGGFMEPLCRKDQNIGFE